MGVHFGASGGPEGRRTALKLPIHNQRRFESMVMNKMLASGIAAMLAVTGASPLVAQDWPNQPIRLIVPYSAGGAADTIARTVADELTKTLGQQVVVENVTGAGGVAGVSRVSVSPADGYTFG